jgi:hypothetical protein
VTTHVPTYSCGRFCRLSFRTLVGSFSYSSSISYRGVARKLSPCAL